MAKDKILADLNFDLRSFTMTPSTTQTQVFMVKHLPTKFGHVGTDLRFTRRGNHTQVCISDVK